MSLAGAGGRILCNAPHRTPCSRIHPRRPFFTPLSPSSPRHPHSSPLTLSATSKKASSSSKTGKFDRKNRRSSLVQTEEQEPKGPAEIGAEDSGAVVDDYDDGFVMPKLPGDEPDFWEGPQWDAFGFFIQYLWAFGVPFAIIACGFAVATYNEGATDFKDTPAYKEAIQSQELLQEQDTSSSDIFDSNPTEEAPSLE